MVFKLSYFILGLCFILILLFSAFRPTHHHIHEDLQQLSQTVPNQNEFTDMCAHIKTEIMAMDQKRTALALAQLNQKIRWCLPFMSKTQQHELLQLTHKMYDGFKRPEYQPFKNQDLQAIEIETL